MEDISLDERLKTRIPELYKVPTCQVKVDAEIIDEMQLQGGVRQGCPLSSVLFHTTLPDFDEEMHNTQRRRSGNFKQNNIDNFVR